MNIELATKEIEELFLRVVNKYNAFEKLPARHAEGHGLYHSERHMIDRIGDNPGMNITGLARASGVTKGAISQIVKKLEAKGIVERRKGAANDKEVFVLLTETGRELYKERRKINRKTIEPLIEELKRHSEDKVEFLAAMFRWLEGFIDKAIERMRSHQHVKE